ncbi:MAG: carboxypeptidase-like regulatory domain-containing protein, partial [Acidobacteria bacterium]|nr:carboxypeptidase-like regulatory domain-containing protein [Acidobacteriota bacterium]
MKRLLILALLISFGALVGVAGAQTLTGTVAGKVVDEQGGVLPGVMVTLTGKTGAQTQVSDAQGDFRFLGLTPGAYAVKAELQGFRLKQEQNFDVNISKTVDVRLTMAVGGMTETVEVVANAVTIDTSTASTDTAMGQSVLFSMPMTHANPAVNLLNYSPGVNSGSAFGGASDGANSLMLDGVDTRDPEGGTAWAFYNYNIIEEVSVGSLGQPAEYGGFTGAIINTITKSGGNRFSFLSEYRYTDSNLAGKNASADIIAKNVNLATPVQVTKLQDYTVQLGGPIKKDKLFFFGSYEDFKSSRAAPSFGPVGSNMTNVGITPEQIAKAQTVAKAYGLDIGNSDTTGTNLTVKD